MEPPAPPGVRFGCAWRILEVPVCPAETAACCARGSETPMQMKKSMVLLLFLMATRALPQNPKHSAAIGTPTVSADDSCGPIGCVTPENVPATSTQSGSPVVIRSSSTRAQVQSGVENPVGAPLPPTDFEKFVEDSLGHPLPVFGRTLFAGGGSDFAPPTSVAPPADYVLGTGDEVLIRTVGKVDIDARAVIDRNGQIFLPRVGMLTVAGMQLDQLTAFIHSAIAKQFMGFELSVSLGQLRSIQIFVLGQARAPGVYTINSLSTLINALFESGGPSQNGSLRDIQLKRNGAVITHFDVYRLLLAGDNSADVRLLPGDIIYIPVMGPQVAVEGDVDAPAIYELRGASTVGDVINEAGGLTPIAGVARAVLERVVERSRRTIEELSLNDKGLSIPMQGGDILRVFPISPRISDAVTLRGNVAAPGRYAWHAGMRVSDLIPTRATLLTRGYYNRQNALDAPSENRSFSGTGKDAPPATASHETEINWNYAVIERLDPADLTTRLIPFALGEAVDHPGSPDDKELQPGDVVVVYSQTDVALPLELRAKFVRIEGQVKAPGVYRVGPTETLRDLVQRAGGLTPGAYLYASRLTRESVRQDQEVELKALAQQESEEVLSPANTSQTSLTGSAVSNDLELRKAYIAQLNSIHPDGRVVLQLQPDAQGIAAVPNFQLEDGDRFTVPSEPNTINVLGTVYNQGTLRFLPSARAAEYLAAAGGPTRDADRKREFIIRADGTFVSRQAVHAFERLPIYPGDTIAVPPRLRAGAHSVDVLGLTQIISAFALSAVAIQALR
jgi:polysaccharide export outer membrane protein